MPKLPIVDEIINNYEDIPQEEFLAWWWDKEVKWDRELDDKVYRFFTLVTKLSDGLEKKLTRIIQLSVLNENQIDGFLESENDNRRFSQEIRNDIDAEVILHFFSEVSIEDRGDIYNKIKEYFELKSQGDTKQADNMLAVSRYRQALSLLEEPPLQKYGWLDFYRADIAEDISSIEFEVCNYSSAVNDYKISLYFYEGCFCSHHPELAPERARVATNLGAAYNNLGQYTEAVASYKKAEGIYEREYCSNRPELDPERARVAMILGYAYSELDQYTEAVASYKKAEEIYAGEYCSNRPELDPERARVAVNLGNACCEPW